jgi:hypothetical protein
MLKIECLARLLPALFLASLAAWLCPTKSPRRFADNDKHPKE